MAIARTGTPAARSEVVQELVDNLRQPDGYGRPECARALGELGTTAAVRTEVVVALLGALQQPEDSYLRRCASDALRKLGPPVAEEVVELLLASLVQRRGISATANTAGVDGQTDEFRFKETRDVLVEFAEAAATRNGAVEMLIAAARQKDDRLPSDDAVRVIGKLGVVGVRCFEVASD